MGTIDLETVDGLNALKESMINVIDKKIEDKKMSDRLDEKALDNFELSDIKLMFEHILPILFESKKGKSTLALYVNTVRNNPSLRKMYSLCECIKKGNDDIDNVAYFVNEAVNMAKSINAEQYNKGLSSLRSILKEGVVISKISSEEFDKALINEKVNANKYLDYLLKTKKTPANLAEYTSVMSKLINEVTNNSKKNEIKETVEGKSLNNIISEDMEEWTRNVVKDVALAEMSGKDKSILFEEYKQSCIDLIDEAIEKNEDGVEISSRFSAMKEKLSEKKYNEKTVIDDLLTLSELKETLM